MVSSVFRGPTGVFIGTKGLELKANENWDPNPVQPHLQHALHVCVPGLSKIWIWDNPSQKACCLAVKNYIAKWILLLTLLAQGRV
jgi:hypothetical protein